MLQSISEKVSRKVFYFFLFCVCVCVCGDERVEKLMELLRIRFFIFLNLGYKSNSKNTHIQYK